MINNSSLDLNVSEVASEIDKSMDAGDVAGKVEEGISKITGFIVEKILDVGLNLASISIKLLGILLFLGILYVGLHIGKKGVKILMIIISVIFIITLVYSAILEIAGVFW